MAWNGSNGASAPKQKPVSGARAVSKGAIAGVIVVLGAAAALYFLMPASAPIAKTTNSVVSSSEKSRKGDSEKNVAAVEISVASCAAERVGDDKVVSVAMESEKEQRVQNVVTSGLSRVTLIDKIFDHETDRMLAHLLVLEPGSGIIGDSVDVYDGFEDAFNKSLNTPILYDKDDDQYVKELKMAVQALRNELISRRNSGEDIIAVLCETRDQMQQLGYFKQELEEQVISMVNNEMDQNDYEDLVSVANKLLADKGCESLEVPEVLKHALRLKMVSEERGEK